MTKSISNDLRKRILNAVLEGMSARAAAIRYDVSASVAVKLVQRWRATGECKPLPRGGCRRAVLDQEREYLHELLKKHADWSEVELAAHLREARGIELHASNVGRFIRKLGYRYKKNGLRIRTGA